LARLTRIVRQLHARLTAMRASACNGIKNVQPAGSEASLVGYWNFNGTSDDRGLGAFTLTPVNNPVFSGTPAFSTPGTTTSYVYAGTNYANPHAATAIGVASATTTYTYDNNGNVTSAPPWTYAWDYQPTRTTTPTSECGRRRLG